MRLRAKVDANQHAIVKALKMMGCSVCSLASVGDGCPDLLVGAGGVNLLIEVKNREGRGRRLTPEQVTFHGSWKGQAAVVGSEDEAIAEVQKGE